MTESGAGPTLRRALSLPLLTLYGVGTIVGAGIYVLVGKVAGQAGLYAPVAFAVAGLIAALTALSFAELSARFPLSAGEAVYVQRGFGRRRLSLLVGLFIAASGVVSTAALAIGFHGYLAYFFAVPSWLTLTLLIAALALLACWGIAESVTAAAVITVIEVGGLIFILAVTGDAVFESPVPAGDLVPPADAAVWSGIFVGAFLAFYAFIGFEDMVNVAEEVKRPERDLPRAIFIAVAVTGVLYVAVSLTAVLALPRAELAATSAPMALLYERETGRQPQLITIISLVAVVNGALIQIIMASRVLYGLARQGWIPRWLGAVSRRTRTPVRATLLSSAVILASALLFPIEGLAQVTSLLILVVFTLINLALWRIKRRQKSAAGCFSVPRPVPLGAAAACVAFLAVRILSAT